MSNIYSLTYQRFLVRLRQARKEAALTQAQVADRLGKRQNYVSKSESGERRVDIVELVEFARLYQKPLDYFIHPILETLDEEPPPDSGQASA